MIRICLRRDTEVNWTTADPILLEGEIGLAKDIMRMKMGDGTTPWSGLEYLDTLWVPEFPVDHSKSWGSL